MKCLYCSKEINKEEKVDKYYCSEECSEKESIRQELETYETDEVRCPYCEELQQDISDSSMYYEANEDEIECQYCEKKFILSAYTSTSFTANVTEDEINKIYEETLEV